VSTNGGERWQKHSRGLTKDAQADVGEFLRPHFSHLEISKTFQEDQTIFLAGFNGLFKSTNGGQQWQEIQTLSTRSIVGLGVSPDYKNDATVAIGTYVWGNYLSEDGGKTWTAINRGLEELNTYGLARVFNIVFSPNYSVEHILFSGTWSAVVKSTDRGKHWKMIPLTDLRGQKVKGPFAITVSPSFATDRTVYVGTRQGYLFRSTDGGDNFSIVGEVDRPIISLVISPDFSSDQTLYASVPGGVYKTVDSGTTWQSVSGGLVLTQNNAENDVKGDAENGSKNDSKNDSKNFILAISPNYKIDQTVFVGTASGIFQTKSGGENWEKLVNTAYGEDSYIEAIALSPAYQNDQTLIISARGKGLFKSIDDGKTFTPIGNALIEDNYVLSNMIGFPSVGTSPIYFSPDYSTDQTIYGFSGADLFKSEDGGNTWTQINLPTPSHDFWSSARLAHLRLKSSTKLMLIAASVAAILSYASIGYLGLEKNLALRKSQIKVGAALMTFIAVVALLSAG
jgi:photosystem II stability/assembly factor-like uncharacterized protein